MLFYYSKPMPRDLGTCPYMYSISRHSRSGKSNHHWSTWQAPWTSNCPHSPPSAESNVLVAFNWSVHYYCFTVFAHSCMAYTIVAFFIAMRSSFLNSHSPTTPCLFSSSKTKRAPLQILLWDLGSSFSGEHYMQITYLYVFLILFFFFGKMSFWSLDALKAKTLLSSKTVREEYALYYEIQTSFYWLTF